MITGHLHPQIWSYGAFVRDALPCRYFGGAKLTLEELLVAKGALSRLFEVLSGYLSI